MVDHIIGGGIKVSGRGGYARGPAKPPERVKVEETFKVERVAPASEQVSAAPTTEAAAPPAPATAPEEPLIQVPETKKSRLNVDAVPVVQLFKPDFHYRIEMHGNSKGEVVQERILEDGVFPPDFHPFLGMTSHDFKVIGPQGSGIVPQAVQFQIPGARTLKEAWEFFPPCLQQEIQRMDAIIQAQFGKKLVNPRAPGAMPPPPRRGGP
jgi:hypothetical protein